MRPLTADQASPLAAGELQTDAPEQTHALGRALGATAEPGTTLALIGPLGAGKTQLAKGVAAGLGVASVVNSPTFVLMNEHDGRLRLFHVDAYRLAEPNEALGAGLLDERQVAGVTVIEWADRLAGLLPPDRLDLWLQPDRSVPHRRQIAWQAYGQAHARLARLSIGS